MVKKYFFKLIISGITLLSLCLSVNGMHSGDNWSPLPAFYRNNNGLLPLPQLNQQQVMPPVQYNPNLGLNLLAQAALAPQQVVITHQDVQHNGPVEDINEQEQRRKHRNEKKPQEESAEAQPSQTKTHKKPRSLPASEELVVIPADLNEYGTNGYISPISSSPQISTSSSSSSSSSNRHIAPHLNGQNTQAQEPMVLYLDSITDENLRNLRSTHGPITHFVIVNNPRSKKRFTQKLAKLLAKYFPTITHLDLSGVKLSIPGTTSQGIVNYFKHITHLNISGSYIDIKHLIEAAFRKNLRSLNLSMSNINVLCLAQQASFPELRELNLRLAMLTSNTLRALASAHFAPQLERLYLGQLAAIYNQRESFDDLILALSQPGSFPRLRALDLTNWTISEQAVQRLIGADFAPNLEHLNISNILLSQAGLHFLVNRAHSLRQLAFSFSDEQVLQVLNTNSFCSNLEALAIRGNITATGMRSIIQSCTSLRRLRITGTITLEALGALVHSPLALQLETLELNTQPLGVTLAQMLATHYFPRLVELSIPNQDIGDRGVAYLARALFALNLRILNLSNNNLTEVGWFQLAHPETINPGLSQSFSQLQELDLSDNLHPNRPYSTNHALAVSVFQSSPAFRNTLRILDLTNTHIQPNHIAQLAQADLPNLRELSIQNELLDNQMINWLEELGTAPFTQGLTTLALNNQHFIMAVDRDEVLARCFLNLRSVILNHQDRVIRLG